MRFLCGSLLDARHVGITENYIYLLTGNSKHRPETLHHSLAKLIALEFGYDENWILHGEEITE